MRRVLILTILGVSSCVPVIGGGCGGKITEKVMEKAVETSINGEGGKVRLDLRGVPKEVRDLLPPNYEVKVSVKNENEGEYSVADVVRNTTQRKLEEHYTEKLGRPNPYSSMERGGFGSSHKR